MSLGGRNDSPREGSQKRLTKQQIWCILIIENEKGTKEKLAWETRRRKVIYVDIELKETIYFINVYAKNEKDDLTEEEKKAFKAVVKILKEE